MIITFEDFKKLDIRIGKVLSAEKVENTDKLIKLQIDLGAEKRQLVAGMGEFFGHEHFIGKQLVILTNIEPRTFKRVQSQGMILAADVGGKPILLHPEAEIPHGSVVK